MIKITFFAVFVYTFEFHVAHFSADEAMDVAEGHFFVAFALFGTGVVSCSPWLDALTAE